MRYLILVALFLASLASPAWAVTDDIKVELPRGLATRLSETCTRMAARRNEPNLTTQQCRNLIFLRGFIEWASEVRKATGRQNASADVGAIQDGWSKRDIGFRCGNSIVDPGEDCDDGNQASGDGCENDCSFTP